tara:strand:- start:698 stop:2308 length:1611 start_codon:yes stop_codon:yes gene_type:complete
MPEFNSNIIKILCILIFLNGCAYFNTFYNAKSYFEMAEKSRIEKNSESEDILREDYYKKAIEKSDLVINNYPDSKYVLESRFIKAKSLYFIDNFEESEPIFFDILSLEDSDFHDESKYWLSMIKYKKSGSSNAILELNELFFSTDNQKLKSNIALSLGEIFMNNKDFDNSYKFLKSGVDLAENRLLKEKIYYNIANSSFERKSYNEALEYYQSVIDLSLNFERVYNSHLQIIKILRLNNDFEQASAKIKTLMLDSSFEQIEGELQLELLKVEIDLGKTRFVVDDLDILSQNYRGSIISAEANYILHEIFLTDEFKNYEKSKFYLNEILSSNIDSNFKIYADKNKFNLNKLISYEKKIENNSLKEKNIFKSGEILAFNLKKYKTAKTYFVNILNNYPNSEYYLKSIFSLYLIEDNHELKKSYASQILNDYKNSKFAKYIIENENIDINYEPSQMLAKAEKEFEINDNNFLKSYKSISFLYGLSDETKKADFFLANYYHFNDVNIDSARFYYEKIIDDFPFSDQANKSQIILEGMNVQ